MKLQFRIQPYQTDTMTQGNYIARNNVVTKTETTEDFSAVQKDGENEVTCTVRCYSLEAVTAVGYHVNSERGTEFRRWAQYIQTRLTIDNGNLSVYFDSDGTVRKVL